MPIPPSDDLILRYLAGSLDHETAAQVQAYFESSVSLRGVHAGLRQRWYTEALRTAPDVEAARIALLQRIDDERVAVRDGGRGGVGAGYVHAPQILQLGKRSLQRWTWHRAIAIVGLMSIITVGVRIFVRHIMPTPTVRQHYATGPGEVRTVWLSGKTRIVLASNTAMDVTSARVVSLAGEAYFDVETASAVPFIVNTGTISTRVLGTSFDVRYDTLRRDVHVAVTHGKVGVFRVGHPNGHTILVAGMMGRVTDSTVTISTEGAEAASRWVDGELVFQRIPVSDVLKAVGQWYGYDLQLADSVLAKQPVVTTVSTRSMTDAFAQLRDLLDVDLTFQGRVATLRPRHHSGRTQPLRKPFTDSLLFSHEVGR